jgi:hypothetical protein
MFLASHTAWAPWYVARSDDKKSARLNIIKHLLGQIPYEEEPRKKVTLPKRNAHDSRRQPDSSFNFIPEVY